MLRHVDFDDAVSVFSSALASSGAANPAEIESGSVWFFPSFEIPMPLRLGYVTIGSSRTVVLSATHVSSVSKASFSAAVCSGKDDGYLQACLASVASSVLTLCFGRLVDYGWDHFRLFSGLEPPHLLPYVKYGPGANPISVSEMERQGRLAHVIWAHIENSIGHEDKELNNFLRCCRLYWLSMKAAQFDQSLAFSLVVAALESVASKAVDVSKVCDGDWSDVKKRIKKVAVESDLPADFIETLKTKLDQHYLGKRVYRFVEENSIADDCLISSHAEVIRKDLGVEYSPLARFVHDGDDDEFEREIKENYHSVIRRIISKSYLYRSKMLHMGESHPAPRFENSDRYVKVKLSMSPDGQPEKKKFPSLRLISAVMRSSVLRYYAEKFSLGIDDGRI